jgi:transketolase
MAANKKSFILYCDVDEIIKDLPNDIKGQLFQLIVDYVNDRNPQPTDLLLKTAFAPIKAQLKRDLLKWDEIRSKRSEAGRASADKRQQKSTHVESVEQTSTNSTVSVTVTDNVNVTVNDTDNVNEVFSRRLLESEIDLQAMEVSTRFKVTKYIVDEFIAHLTNEGKKHLHYNEWKKHLRNWLTKRPELKNNFNKPTGQEPPTYKRL